MPSSSSSSTPSPSDDEDGGAEDKTKKRQRTEDEDDDDGASDDEKERSSDIDIDDDDPELDDEDDEDGAELDEDDEEEEEEEGEEPEDLDDDDDDDDDGETEDDDGLDDGLDDDDDEEDEETESVRSDSNDEDEDDEDDDEDEDDEDDDDDIAYETLKADFKKREREAAMKRKKEATKAAMKMKKDDDDDDDKGSSSSSAEQQEKEEKEEDEDDEGNGWTCDVCKTATFKTFDEACEHEATCDGGQGQAADGQQGQAAGADDDKKATSKKKNETQKKEAAGQGTAAALSASKKPKKTAAAAATSSSSSSSDAMSDSTQAFEESQQQQKKKRKKDAASSDANDFDSSSASADEYDLDDDDVQLVTYLANSNATTVSDVDWSSSGFAPDRWHEFMKFHIPMYKFDLPVFELAQYVLDKTKKTKKKRERDKKKQGTKDEDEEMEDEAGRSTKKKEAPATEKEKMDEDKGKEDKERAIIKSNDRDNENNHKDVNNNKDDRQGGQEELAVWACDKCSRRFILYDIAVRHEETCTGDGDADATTPPNEEEEGGGGGTQRESEERTTAAAVAVDATAAVAETEKEVMIVEETTAAALAPSGKDPSAAEEGLTQQELEERTAVAADAAAAEVETKARQRSEKAAEAALAQAKAQAVDDGDKKDDDADAAKAAEKEKGGNGPVVMMWTCDVCKAAHFPTYEEACAHEATCSGVVAAAEGGKVVGAAAAADAAATTEKDEKEAKVASNKKSSSDGGAHEVIEVPSSSDSDDSDDEDTEANKDASSSSSPRRSPKRKRTDSTASSTVAPPTSNDDDVVEQQQRIDVSISRIAPNAGFGVKVRSSLSAGKGSALIDVSPSHVPALKEGDEIVSVNGQSVTGMKFTEVVSSMKRTAPGDDLRLSVIRRRTTNTTAASSKRVRIDSSSSAAAPAPDQQEEEEEVSDVFTTFLPRLDSGGFGITLRTSPPWLVRKAPSTSSIRKGDEVIEVNTIQTSRIVHLETFKEIVQKTPPGVELQLKVSRRRSPGSNGAERATTTATERSERTTTASLEEQPQPEEEARAATKLVATATDGHCNYYSVSLVEPGSLGLFFKASEDVGMNYFDRGAIITRVIPDSPADRAGIQPGDVVCATVGTGREAYAYSDFLAACSSAARPVNFNVRRPIGNAATPVSTATVEESSSDPQQLQRPSWEEAATAIPHSSPPLPLVCDVCGGGEDDGTNAKGGKGIMCRFGAASDNSSCPATITVHFSCGINPPDNKREYAIVSEENILHKHHEKTLCQGLSMGFDEAELQGIVKDVLSKMKCVSEIDIGAKPVRFYLASEVQGVLKEGLLAAYLRRRSEGAASAPSSVNEEAEKGTAIAAPTESAAAAAETSQNLESMDVNLFEAQENAAQLDDGQRSIEENQTSSCPETASADETEPPYERQHSSVGEELLAGEKPTLPPTSSRDDVTTQATLADSDGIVAAPAARPTVNVCSICGQAQGDSPLCIFPSTHTDSGDGTLWCVHASCGLRASFPNVNRPEYEILSAASIEASYFFLFPDRQATLRNLLLQTRSAVVSVNGKEEHFYLASDFRRRISSAMPASNVAEDVATDRGAVKDSAPLGAALGRLGSAELAEEIDEQPYIDIDTDGQHDKAKEGNGAAMVMAGTTENHQGSVEGNTNIEARVKSRPLTLPGLPVWQKHGKVCRSEEKIVAPLTDEEDEPLDISDDSDVEEDSDASDDESRTYGSPKPIIDVAIARQPGGGFGITIQSNSRDNAYVVSAKKQPLVKSGDKILFVNGKNTAGASFERIVEWVRGTPQGQSLRLKLERRNPKLSPRKRLPAKHQPPLTETSFSVSLTEPGRLGFLIEKRPEDGGAIVARVVPDSQASRVGLLAGDIICDPRRAGRAGYNYEDFVKECSGSKRPVVFIVKRPIVTSGAKGRVDVHQQRPTGGITVPTQSQVTVPTQSQVSSPMARSNLPLFAPAHHAAHSYPTAICRVCGRGNMGTPMCTFPGKNMGAAYFEAFSIHVACGLSASLPSINKANFEIMPESAVRTTFGGSPLNLILPQVRSAVSCFAGQYTTYYLMSDFIAHLSRKNYYSSALALQNTGNGPVPSTTTPKSGANGLYLRPAGRGRKGMNWDPVRGVWVPLTQGATHDSVIVGMPASKFSEDQISKMPAAFAYTVNDGGKSEQQAIIATAQWSRGEHAAQREKKRKASTPSKEGSAAKRGGSGRKPFGSGSKEISSGPSDDFPGFTVKVFERMGGHTKGRPDLYWFSPKTSKKLRSKVEVKRFIAALEETAGDEDQAWNIIKKR